MSTYQPPGEPPQGPPGYVLPQDPWAIPEHGGLASMPTDPIPQQQEQPEYAPPQYEQPQYEQPQYEQPQYEQPQYEQPQYAPPQYGQPQYPTGSDVGAQPTVAHDGQFGQPMMPQPQRNRAGMLAIIFVAVLVLGGGGVYAGFYFVKNRGSNNPPATQSGLQAVQVNQCLVNAGTQADPDMQLSSCSAPNSFKAVKVVHGDAVPRDSHGVVDPKPAAATVCGGQKYDYFYAYWDPEAPAQYLIICLAQNLDTVRATTTGS
jgi:hypothetical protein